MKKIISLVSFAAILLFASSVSAAYNTTTFGQLISVTNPLVLENAATNPSVVYVGSNFIFMGTVENNAPETLNGVTLTIVGGFPFSNVSPLESFNVGDLIPGQTYTFSIPLQIDNDATNIQYTLSMTASYSYYEASQTAAGYVVGLQTIMSGINVNKGADIEIVNVTLPQPLQPNTNDNEVIVYIENNGTNAADQVQLNLAAEYPFIPSGKTYFIDKINPGQIVPAIFHVDVDSSAVAQLSPIDMLIKWKEGNNQYSDTQTFGLPVTVVAGPLNLSNNYLIAVVVIIILGAGGFIFWKRFGKKIRR